VRFISRTAVLDDLRELPATRFSRRPRSRGNAAGSGGRKKAAVHRDFSRRSAKSSVAKAKSTH